MAATSSTSSSQAPTLNLDRIACRPETKKMLEEINKMITESLASSKFTCGIIHKTITGRNVFFVGEDHLECAILRACLEKGAKERYWRIFHEYIPTHGIQFRSYLNSTEITYGYAFGLEPGLFKMFVVLAWCTFEVYQQEKNGLAPGPYIYTAIWEGLIENLVDPECVQALKNTRCYPEIAKLFSEPSCHSKALPSEYYRTLALEILKISKLPVKVFQKFQECLLSPEIEALEFVIKEGNRIREYLMANYFIEIFRSFEICKDKRVEFDHIDTFVVTGVCHTLNLLSLLEPYFSPTFSFTPPQVTRSLHSSELLSSFLEPHCPSSIACPSSSTSSSAASSTSSPSPSSSSSSHSPLPLGS